MKCIHYLMLSLGMFFMSQLSARSSAMRGLFGGAGTGALIGGLAGGGRGAGYGALAGGVLGTAIGASEDSKRRRRYRYYDDYYDDYDGPYVDYADDSYYGNGYHQQYPRYTSRRGGYAGRSSRRRSDRIRRTGRNRRTV